jgi:hypothetical protein
MTIQFNPWPYILTLVGTAFMILLSIIGFGIKNRLKSLEDTFSRIDGTLKEIFAKLDLVMTKERCREHHDAHQKQHDLEKENHKTEHEAFRGDLNGIGRKLEGHIQHKVVHGG